MVRGLLLLFFLFITGCSADMYASNNKDEDDFFGVSEEPFELEDNSATIVDDTTYSDGVNTIPKIGITEAENNYAAANSVEGLPIQTISYTPNKPAESFVSPMPAEARATLKEDPVKISYTLSLKNGDSLKSKLNLFLKQYGYKLIWKTEYDVFFENEVVYYNDSFIPLLKNIASDLMGMGIDVHMNVYVKNNVVLVYSVRN
ncbi:MAG: TcpQ domain-containing protein [Vibrionaceae bacterium]